MARIDASSPQCYNRNCRNAFLLTAIVFREIGYYAKNEARGETRGRKGLARAMGAELNSPSKTAYAAVVQPLKETGRVGMVHPIGTGGLFAVFSARKYFFLPE